MGRSISHSKFPPLCLGSSIIKLKAHSRPQNNGWKHRIKIGTQFAKLYVNNSESKSSSFWHICRTSSFNVNLKSKFQLQFCFLCNFIDNNQNLVALAYAKWGLMPIVFIYTESWFFRSYKLIRYKS